MISSHTNTQATTRSLNAPVTKVKKNISVSTSLPVAKKIIPAMFTTSFTPTPKLVPQKRSALSEDEETDEEQDGDGPEAVSVFIDPSELIDIVPKHKSTKKKGGRPSNHLIDSLVQKCYRINKPQVHIYRCVGRGCGSTLSNRNLGRTIRHARDCHHLPSNLQEQAKAYARSKAPSQMISNSTSMSSIGGDTECEDLGGRVVVKKTKVESKAAVVQKSVHPARLKTEDDPCTTV